MSSVAAYMQIKLLSDPTEQQGFKAEHQAQMSSKVSCRSNQNSFIHRNKDFSMQTHVAIKLLNTKKNINSLCFTHVVCKDCIVGRRLQFLRCA